jgi:hypothetical protein
MIHRFIVSLHDKDPGCTFLDGGVDKPNLNIFQGFKSHFPWLDS